MSAPTDEIAEAPFARRILLLVPHPDDEVVGVAAFVRAAIARRCEVYAAYLTDGVPAADVLWPWQRRARPNRVARRQAEAARVRDILGHETALVQDLPTRTLRLHLDTTYRELEDLIRTRHIECVWAPAYEGGHQDHDCTNYLARQLAAEIPVYEFCEYHFAGGRVTCNSFIETLGTEWSVTLDRGERELKQQLLDLYQSERSNLSYVTVDQEQLRPLHAYDYRWPPHPGKTFYQRFQWVPWHPRIDYTTPAEVSTALARFAPARCGSGAPGSQP